MRSDARPDGIGKCRSVITLNCSSKQYSMDGLIDLIVVLSLELGSLTRREGRTWLPFQMMLWEGCLSFVIMLGIITVRFGWVRRSVAV